MAEAIASISIEISELSHSLLSHSDNKAVAVGERVVVTTGDDTTGAGVVAVNDSVGAGVDVNTSTGVTADVDATTSVGAGVIVVSAGAVVDTRNTVYASTTKHLMDLNKFMIEYL